MQHLREITSDVFDIADRLKAIDGRYRLFLQPYCKAVRGIHLYAAPDVAGCPAFFPARRPLYPPRAQNARGAHIRAA